MSEKTKHPLFTKDFTLVVIGQIISLFGNTILRFAMPLYILYESGSEALFGLVSAIAFLPMIIMSPIGGIIADRVNKQRVMVLLDFTTCGIMLLFLVFFGKVSVIPLIVVVMMILFGIQGAYAPTVQASLPFLVQENQLMPANAVINLVQSLSGLLGPVIGALLMSRYGLIPIVVLSVCCFFFSAVMELFIKIPYQKQKASGTVWQMVKSDMQESGRFILKEEPVFFRVICIVFSINLFMSSMLMIGLPILVTKTLGLSTDLYGITQGALAAGGLLGGVLAGSVATKMKVQHSYIWLIASGVAILPMSFVFLVGAPPMVCYTVLTVISFLLMICATIFSIQMLAFVQEMTPGEIIGKVIALVLALSMAAQPFGQAMYGVLFKYLASMPWVILLGSGMVTLFIAVFSKKTFAALQTQ